MQLVLDQIAKADENSQRHMNNEDEYGSSSDEEDDDQGECDDDQNELKASSMLGSAQRKLFILLNMARSVARTYRGWRELYLTRRLNALVDRLNRLKAQDRYSWQHERDEQVMATAFNALKGLAASQLAIAVDFARLQAFTRHYRAFGEWRDFTWKQAMIDDRMCR